TNGFDEDGIADALADAQNLLRVVERQFTVRTGNAGYARASHFGDGRSLVTHQSNGFRARADEGETALLHAFGKIGIFREKSVARMYRLGVGDFRRADDRTHVEVTLCRLRSADANGFVRQQNVFLIPVAGRVYSYRLDVEFMAGSQYA